MANETHTAVAPHYSPGKPVPASLVVSSIAAVVVLVVVILGYALWTARDHHSPRNLAREAQSALHANPGRH